MELNKRDTNVLKGIAIIGMMMLHFWSHPEWVDATIWWNSILNANIYMRVGQFGNVCVSIFAFLTGYSFCTVYYKWDDSKYRIKKIASFLASYWVYELIFYFIGVVIFENDMPGTKNLLLNAVGLETAIGTDYICVPFAWYVSFYLLIVLLYPVIKKLMNLHGWNILIIIIIYFLLKMLTKEVPILDNFYQREATFCVVCIGYLFKKYSLITKIISIRDKYIWKFLMVCISVIVIWVLGYDLFIDWWGTLYTILIVLLVKSQFLQRIKLGVLLRILGKYSMGMWFISGIFFMPNIEMQKLAFLWGNPVLILLWVLCITCIFSFVVDEGLLMIKRCLFNTESSYFGWK